jgi:dolichol-phosphate mannosyltransferase
VILPTYNEVDNIEMLVAEIDRVLSGYKLKEIIIVDDNSYDGTLEKISALCISNSLLKLISNPERNGLGKSIGLGLKLAVGDLIAVMDSDFTHRPIELTAMIGAAHSYDFVNGSRFCSGGSMASKNHYLASLVFNWVIRLILQTRIRDNLGGYWVMNSNAKKFLVHDKIFFGYGDYYFRLIHYIQANKLSIVEVPAKYESRKFGESKSNFFKLFFSYLFQTLVFRKNLSKNS